MPNFKLDETQLITRLDKWLYFIKYLEDFQSIPTIIEDEVFNKAFEKAEIAKFGEKEMASYEKSLKIYRDLKNVIDTAFDDGKIEGKLEGKIEMAKFMKSENEAFEKIIKYTGLTKEEIEKL
jgi:predicted transposase/invertase (TIGR01784 family)